MYCHFAQSAVWLDNGGDKNENNKGTGTFNVTQKNVHTGSCCACVVSVYSAYLTPKEDVPIDASSFILH